MLINISHCLVTYKLSQEEEGLRKRDGLVLTLFIKTVHPGVEIIVSHSNSG